MTVKKKSKRKPKTKISKSDFIRKYPKESARQIQTRGKKIGLLFSHKYVYVVRGHDRLVGAAKKSAGTRSRKRK